jgi:hypothetical protein
VRTAKQANTTAPQNGAVKRIKFRINFLLKTAKLRSYRTIYSLRYECKNNDVGKTIDIGRPGASSIMYLKMTG